MGRKKLEIKRIESKASRQVTFTKRRNGLIKKAKELSILCEVDLGLIILSARGKLFDFTNSNNSLPEIIQRYNTYVELEANESNAIYETEKDHNKTGTFLTVKELLHAAERHLDGSEQLSRTDLVDLEDQLQGALQETRARKTQLMMADVTILEEKEKMLIEENRLLSEQLALAGKKTDDGNEEIALDGKKIDVGNEEIALTGKKLNEGNEETDIDLNRTPATLKLF